jgi:outer membrane protein assembly factor BamB
VEDGTDAAVEGTVEAARPPPRARRSRWLTTGVPALVVVLVLAGAGLWWFSPWEHLSGAHGTPPRAVSGVPTQGADRFRDTGDPVLVAGALVERHDGGVRAVDLQTGRTWWGLSRPGRVHVTTVDGVDGRYAAIMWSDRRLTIVDVSSGRRVHVHLPDRSSNLKTGDAKEEATAGLTGPAGRPVVAVVQDRGVDAYDASTGRRVWSRTAPNDCFFWDQAEDGTLRADPFLSLDINCVERPAPDKNVPTMRYAYSTLLDASSGRPLQGFGRFPDGSLMPVGDHELLQEQINGVQNLGYRVIDSRTGRTLWHVDQSTKLDMGLAGVSGGDGLVVVTDGDSGRISAYRAADGRRLWRRTFRETAGAYTELRFGTVIGGQVRVVELRPAPAKVLTFDATGKTIGTQDLPMFAQGGDPQPVGGDYGTLIINDVNANTAHDPHPYVLLTASRQVPRS